MSKIGKILSLQRVKILKSTNLDRNQIAIQKNNPREHQIWRSKDNPKELLKGNLSNPKKRQKAEEFGHLMKIIMIQSPRRSTKRMKEGYHLKDMVHAVKTNCETV